MLKKLLAVVFLLAGAQIAHAQGPFYPVIATALIKGTTLPAKCSVGQVFFKTNASAGSNIYGCTAANTWTAQAGGGGGGATIPATTNIINGDGAGNGADSGIVPASVQLLNTVRTVSGTTDTLLAADNGNTVRYTSSSAVTVTIPAGLAVGFNAILAQDGSGIVSPLASSTTFTTSASTNGVGSQINVLSRSTNTYTMTSSGPNTSILTCQPKVFAGPGSAVITAGAYTKMACVNEFNSTWTITAIKCYTDNSGTSTLTATNGAGTALLTGPITCSSAIASGTQSATVTIAAGDYIKFTFTADGISQDSTFLFDGTRQ